jgi:hypothetical protein
MAAQTRLLPLLDEREAAEQVFNRLAVRFPDVSLVGEPGGEPNEDVGFRESSGTLSRVSTVMSGAVVLVHEASGVPGSEQNEE